jgi:asparagine synthase (glutamine-hydrolysing)
MNAFMMSYWRKPEEIVLGAHEPGSTYTRSDHPREISSMAELMMMSDLLQYLPDDILVKCDRASMATSLEVRAPLLDYRLVELAWRMPLEVKWRGHVGKWPLRQLLRKYVPAELFERPKMGFGVPLEDWLRGPLRDWAENLLDPARLRRDSLFDAAKVRERWVAHRDGLHNWAPHLWNILSVQAWLDAQSKPRSIEEMQSLHRPSRRAVS